MTNEAIIRFGFFFGIFILFSVLEILKPRRNLRTSKGNRWTTNIGITIVDTALLRLIFSSGAVGFAIFVSERKLGFFNMTGIPYWMVVVLSVIILDFIIYLQHVMFHMIPLFWRLHRMHHTDLDIDVTSGTRFHPLEILLSMGIKIGAIFFLGTPPLSVLIFEIVLNATSMFNHSNIYIPIGLDRILRLFVVTPDMHRVHHSVIIKEFNSNFGFNIPWWDRFLGTYRSQPKMGHKDMTIGLAQLRDEKKLSLFHILIQPFTR